jgi:hypothetical protein
MEGFRLLSVQIEVHGHVLGGNKRLLSVAEVWLRENSCRQLLAHVLAEHHQRPDFLAIVEEAGNLSSKKQQENSMIHLYMREFVNATSCMYISVSTVILFVIKSTVPPL